MKKQFEDLCQNLCDPETCTRTFYKIIAQYDQTQRYYHTFNGHIAFCLKELENVPDLSLTDKQILTLSLLMHDAFMDFSRNDNEESSAVFAATLCQEIKIPQEITDHVTKCIVATKHNNSLKDQNACITVDIDLAIFGQERHIFNAYERNIRKEFHFVPEKIFKEKRIKILTRFLDQESIFHTIHFQKKYEIRAQKNLIDSIKKLRS